MTAGQLFQGAALPVIVSDGRIAQIQLLPVAGQLAPGSVLIFYGWNVNVSWLNILLKLLYQAVRKNHICINIFHTGFLLEIRCQAAKPAESQRLSITPCIRRWSDWPCMESCIVVSFFVHTHVYHRPLSVFLKYTTPFYI